MQLIQESAVEEEKSQTRNYCKVAKQSCSAIQNDIADMPSFALAKLQGLLKVLPLHILFNVAAE